MQRLLLSLKREYICLVLKSNKTYANDKKQQQQTQRLWNVLI